MIIPVYPSQDRYEGAALDAYQRAFPSGYELVTIDADRVIEMGGAVHCTTMSFNLSRGQIDPASTAREPSLDRGSAPVDRIFSSSPQLMIADLSTASDVIEVPALSPAPARATVAYSIAHSYPGDLRVTLQKDGQRVVLFDRDQHAGGALERSASLSLRGFNADGRWTLSVSDQEERDEGVLVSWSLSFE